MSVGLELGLNFPLMSVVDFAGFRFVTVSFLPISEKTLCCKQEMYFSVLYSDVLSK